MAAALIIGSLLALCLGVAGWIWLVAGFHKGGVRGAAGMAALQISALCLIWGLLRGDPIVGLYKALLPPLAGVELVQLAQFGGFMRQALWAAAPWAVGALALGLVWRPLRPWAPGIGAAVLMVAAVILGEGISQRAMCAGAASAGLSDLRRISLSQSLQQVGPVAYHGLARDAEGKAWGWSYRQLGWFPLTVANPSRDGQEPFGCAGG